MGPLDAERACAGVCSLASQDMDRVVKAVFLYGADAFCLTSGGRLALSEHPEGAEPSSERTEAMNPGGNLPPEAAGRRTCRTRSLTKKKAASAVPGDCSVFPL